jgi:hypothetical protein
MKVEVTQEDINQGTKGNPDSCPIVLAVKRLMAKYVHIQVYSKELVLSTKDYESIHKLPAEARRFIELLDGEMEVTPITFEVEISID